MTQKSEQELQQASLHIEYEILRLGDAYDGWRNCADAKDKQQDLMLEAFLLHYRNLRNFFIGSGNKKDDMKAQHFVPGWKSPQWPDHIARSTYTEQNLINKRLAHLTYARCAIEAHIDTSPWPVTRMLETVKRNFESFYLEISKHAPTRQVWFEHAVRAFSTPTRGSIPAEGSTVR